jgi:hypothetical protein
MAAGNPEATTEVTASFLRHVGAWPVEEWWSTLRGEAERATEVVDKGERESKRVYEIDEKLESGIASMTNVRWKIAFEDKMA